MRVEITLAGLLLALDGCAVDLDPPDPPPAAEPTRRLKACRPETELVRALSGRVNSGRIGSDVVLLRESSAEPWGAGVNVTGTPCQGSATRIEGPLFDLTPLDVTETDVAITPLAVVGEDEVHAYFAAYARSDAEAAVAAAGYGVARWDAERDRFVAQAILWTSDRPSFGSGAVIADGYVYVYGGLAARFLDADVYVARAPLQQLAQFDAYEYPQSGGGWQPSIDAANPMVVGGTSPSVAWHPNRKRWVLAYATPLSTTVTLRSGLGPAGPWSLPVALGGCALPSVDEGAFCADVVLHAPFFEADLLLSHAVATFERPKAAKDSDYSARWINAQWPEELP